MPPFFVWTFPCLSTVVTPDKLGSAWRLPLILEWVLELPQSRPHFHRIFGTWKPHIFYCINSLSFFFYLAFYCINSISFFLFVFLSFHLYTTQLFKSASSLLCSPVPSLNSPSLPAPLHRQPTPILRKPTASYSLPPQCCSQYLGIYLTPTCEAW